MLCKLAILPLLFAVLLVSTTGCGKKNDEVTFKPVPEGTPTVTTGGPPGNTGAPAPPKSNPVVEDR
jgi:hypothetical protein